jgi:MarR family multiple gene transcriptional regulator MgrA
MPTHYGHLARVLHACADQTVTTALAQMDLTAAQGHVLGYITHRKDPPCPRDIEDTFQLTHPTVSGLLARLEKKDFIALLPDETDRRCKRIHVLPKAIQCQQTMHQTILANEDRLVRGFSEAEKACFATLLNRAIGNMGADPCPKNPIHKEETGK